MHSIISASKNFIDMISYSVVVGVFVKLLPVLAAAASLTWFVIRIYDRFKYGPSKGE